jgi:hypothetical protein
MHPFCRTIYWLGLLVLCVSIGHGAVPTDSPRDSITADEIRGHVYFLAGKELGGRWPGSPGLRIASLYATSQFRSAGLLPAFRDGDKLSYFQPVPVVKRSIRSAPILQIRTPAGEKTFVHGRDFKWFAGSLPAESEGPLRVVDAGYAISEPESGWDDLRGLDVEDKIVLIKMGVPPAGLPEALLARYGKSNAIMRKITDLIPRRPAAVLIAATPEIDAQWEHIPTIDANPPFAYKDPAADHVGIPFIGFLKSEVGKTLRPGGGRETPGDVRGVTALISASVDDEELQAWNLAGLVEGRDPALKDQVVVVSAHLDHLAPDPSGAIFPGANDNASGSAALLEIAEAMARCPARRSVLFVLFTAEEGGTMGAIHFLSHPPLPRGLIVADINMDMIGRNEAASADGCVQYALDSEVVRPAFRRLIAEVNERTVRWPLAFDHPRGLGDSDHRIFEAYRIPAVNFYSGKNPDTHQPTDTPDKIDYAKAEAVARLVFELARELGERDSPWK